jgi:hypothetical protein
MHSSSGNEKNIGGLSSVLTVNEDNEIVPRDVRFDVRAAFDEVFSEVNPPPMTYSRYERWCRQNGKEPNPQQWAEAHGLWFAEKSE